MGLFFTYIINCFSILFTILTFGLLIGFLENQNTAYSNAVFGKKVTLLTSYIGTPIHELGHLFFVILFGHKVEKVVLFPTKEGLEKGYLGCVNHSYNKNSFYQKFGNFFIGIGPMISGPIVILVLFKLFLKSTYNELYVLVINNEINIINILKNVFTLENLADIKFYIFIFISINIANHAGLSWPDIKHSLFSLTYIFIIIIIFGIYVILDADIANLIINYLKLINSFFVSIFGMLVVFAVLNNKLLSMLYKISK